MALGHGAVGSHARDTLERSGHLATSPRPLPCRIGGCDARHRTAHRNALRSGGADSHPPEPRRRPDRRLAGSGAPRGAPLPRVPARHGVGLCRIGWRAARGTPVGRSGRCHRTGRGRGGGNRPAGRAAVVAGSGVGDLGRRGAEHRPRGGPAAGVGRGGRALAHPPRPDRRAGSTRRWAPRVSFRGCRSGRCDPDPDPDRSVGGGGRRTGRRTLECRRAGGAPAAPPLGRPTDRGDGAVACPPRSCRRRGRHHGGLASGCRAGARRGIRGVDLPRLA